MSARALMSSPAVGSSSSRSFGRCKQRPRDFETPHLSAGELARLVARAVGETDPFKQRSLARDTFAARETLQGAVIGEVLRDREIEVERALLEYHAEPRKRRAALARDIVAKDADAA